MLRRFGNDLVSIEDCLAESSLPIDKVAAEVKNYDMYVDLVAQRYRYRRFTDGRCSLLRLLARCVPVPLLFPES